MSASDKRRPYCVPPRVKGYPGSATPHAIHKQHRSGAVAERHVGLVARAAGRDGGDGAAERRGGDTLAARCPRPIATDPQLRDVNEAELAGSLPGDGGGAGGRSRGVCVGFR